MSSMRTPTTCLAGTSSVTPESRKKLIAGSCCGCVHLAAVMSTGSYDCGRHAGRYLEAALVGLQEW